MVSTQNSPKELEMFIIFYSIIIFSTTLDEIWNINNPRPNPKKHYYCLQWEEKDFYSYKIENQWILRKYRKTDSSTKRQAREEYWEKLLKFEK